MTDLPDQLHQLQHRQYDHDHDHNLEQFIALTLTAPSISTVNTSTPQTRTSISIDCEDENEGEKTGECSSVRSCVVVHDRSHLRARRPEAAIGVFALPPPSWSVIISLFECFGLSTGQLSTAMGWHYGAWEGVKKRKATLPERRLAWLIWRIYILPDPKYGWLKAAMLEEPRGGWPWKRGVKGRKSAQISAQERRLFTQLFEPEATMQSEIEKRSLASGRKPPKWRETAKSLLDLARQDKSAVPELENPS